jgi:hypothetical protein
MESAVHGIPGPAPSWVGLAARWQHVQTPLRPDHVDSRHAQQAIDAVAASCPQPKVLLLGVTPELARLRFPDRASLLAVDSSREMIGALWKPSAHCGSLAVRARWESLPVKAGGIDLVLADGSFCCLPDMASISRVMDVVASAMDRGALMHLRTFVRPDIQESIESILLDVCAGIAGSVHAAKWRVAMALQGSSDDGVALADVWRVFERLGDRRQLCELTGWPQSAAATLDAYRNATSRMCFPSLSITRKFLGVHFDELTCRVPDYELGERCPSFLLRKR